MSGGPLDLGSRRRRTAGFLAVYLLLSLVGAGTFASAVDAPPVVCPEPGSPLPVEQWPRECPVPAVAEVVEVPDVAVTPQPAERGDDAPAAPADEPTPSTTSTPSTPSTPADATAPPEPAATPAPAEAVPATGSASASPAPTGPAATAADETAVPEDSSGTTQPAAPAIPGAPTGEAGPAAVPVDPGVALPATPEVAVPAPAEVVPEVVPPYPTPALPPATISLPEEAPVDAAPVDAVELQRLAAQIPRAFGETEEADDGGTRRPRTVRPTVHVEGEEDGHDHEHDGVDAAPGGGIAFSPVDVDWSTLTPLVPPSFDADEAARFPGPSFLLPIYQAASAEYDIPWQVLASINEIETNYGRNQGPSSAGAVGWMQFMPSTWQAYGVDANGDGVRNPADPVDAIFAAARYLDASGGQDRLDRAVFAYNHAGWYVDKVLRRAVEFGRISPDLLAALTHQGRENQQAIRRATGDRGYLDPDAEAEDIGRVMLLPDAALRRQVLADERISIYPCGRGDIAEGVTDRRIVEMLAILAAKKLHPTVSSLRCGHGYLTASGNVSDHSHGGAVDIAAINGVPIVGNQGRGSVTDKAIRQMLRLQGGMRPSQIISLMTYAGAPNTVAMGDHHDHIHVGFRALRGIQEDAADAPR